MPRQPSVRWDARRGGWVSQAIGPRSPKTGRRLGMVNRDIGAPTGRDGPRNRAAAELWLARELEALAATGRPADDPTLKQLARMYLSWCKGQHEPRTVRGHAERIGLFTRFKVGPDVYGDRAVRDLRATDLSRFITAMKREGYAAGYTNSIVLSVQACMNWAARPVEDRTPVQVLASNPFAGVERPKNPQPPRRYCGPEARRAFLAYAHRRACKWGPGLLARRFDRLTYELLRFCESTGCRPSEACRLEWGHLDWERSRAVLRGKSTRKTGRPRVIPLTGDVLRVLRRIERLEGRHARFVFTHSHHGRSARGRGDLAGVPWVAHALAHLVARWRGEAIAEAEARGEESPIKAEGPDALTLYGFRRDLGADVLRMGGSYAEVAEVLGNSAAVAERHYASYASDHAVNLARQVAERRRSGGKVE